MRKDENDVETMRERARIYVQAEPAGGGNCLGSGRLDGLWDIDILPAKDNRICILIISIHPCGLELQAPSKKVPRGSRRSSHGKKILKSASGRQASSQDNKQGWFDVATGSLLHHSKNPGEGLKIDGSL